MDQIAQPQTTTLKIVYGPDYWELTQSLFRGLLAQDYYVTFYTKPQMRLGGIKLFVVGISEIWTKAGRPYSSVFKLIGKELNDDKRYEVTYDPLKRTGEIRNFPWLAR